MLNTLEQCSSTPGPLPRMHSTAAQGTQLVPPGMQVNQGGQQTEEEEHKSRGEDFPHLGSHPNGLEAIPIGTSRHRGRA